MQNKRYCIESADLWKAQICGKVAVHSKLCICVLTDRLCICAVLQFLSGPGNDTLTVIRLKSSGWNMWYTVSTLRSFVAPRRPLPRQAFSMQKYRCVVCTLYFM